MPPSPRRIAIWWDLRTPRTFRPVTASKALGPKQQGGHHEALFWRVGIWGSLLMSLTFLPIPLKPQGSLCGFLWLTGRPCPFCGITRALACLLKGDVALALSFHPLSPLALTALLLVFLGGPGRMIWEHLGWRTLPRGRLRFFWTGSLMLFLVYGAWRICVGRYS